MPELSALAPDCRAVIEQVASLPTIRELGPVQSRAAYAVRVAAMRERWYGPRISWQESWVNERRVRWYEPRPVPLGTLVWFHGGGWVIGDLQSTDAACRMAAYESDFRIASVDYRLAPENPFPAAYDDAYAVVSALAWTAERPLFVGGESAGANLAAAIARDLAPLIDGQVLICPPTDPYMRSESYRSMGDGPMLTRDAMEYFYEQYLSNDSDKSDPRVNLDAATDDQLATCPPAVIMTVGFDVLRDEGIAYAQRLMRVGVPVVHMHAPDVHHGAFSSSGLMPTAERWTDRLWAAVKAMA